jgi:hypothetical protein
MAAEPIPLGKRAVRNLAKRSIAALLESQVSTDGDLFAATDELDDEQMEWFTAEVRRIAERTWPT